MMMRSSRRRISSVSIRIIDASQLALFRSYMRVRSIGPGLRRSLLRPWSGRRRISSTLITWRNSRSLMRSRRRSRITSRNSSWIGRVRSKEPQSWRHSMPVSPSRFKRYLSQRFRIFKIKSDPFIIYTHITTRSDIFRHWGRYWPLSWRRWRWLKQISKERRCSMLPGTLNLHASRKASPVCLRFRSEARSKPNAVLVIQQCRHRMRRRWANRDSGCILPEWEGCGGLHSTSPAHCLFSRPKTWWTSDGKSWDSIAC